MTMTGIVLMIQNIFDLYASWAYALGINCADVDGSGKTVLRCSARTG